MTILISGLLLFFGVHSVSIVNSAWRDRVVLRIGEGPWKGLYSLFAAGGLALMVYGYGMARQEPIILYVPPVWLRSLAIVLMVPVFPLLFAPYFPGRIKTAAKHPMLNAMKLWGLAHLLVNGTVADVILFGSVIAWAGADRVSMTRREPREIPGAPPSKWNDLIVLALGLTVYGAFIGGAHVWLIGMPIGTPWG